MRLTLPVALATVPLMTVVPASQATSSAPASHARNPQRIMSHASWTVGATRDTHPTRHPEGPRAHAAAHTLINGCPTHRPRAAKNALRGEGILSMTLAAPGTSWKSSQDTAITVTARVDGKKAQQLVLFDGSQPFDYQGFLGPLAAGAHCVTLSVDPTLSHDGKSPRVTVYDVRLGVVPKPSPSYQLMTHAPVMYGRSTSAQSSAQILTDATATRATHHETDLAYTVIWTREDVGDGLIPVYEWGLFGRMTDIETVLHETVDKHGAIKQATYLSCGCEKFPTYPDGLVAPPVDSEIDLAYPHSGTPKPLGRHLVLRDATGNNDMSPHGTSSYRFQQVPVAGPASGDEREVAMDKHPWTYRISEDELPRSTAQSTDAKSLLAGNYPQYLVVDINAEASGAASIAVGVRLRGDKTWFTNDYAQTTAPGPPSGFPFYDGGHARTAIKLPTGWNGTPVTALRLRLNALPGHAKRKLEGKPKIELIEVTRHYRIKHLSLPKLRIGYGTELAAFPSGL